MKKCIIIGASGYSGAQLTQLLLQHPFLELSALAVSEHSAYLNQSFAQHYPQYVSKLDDNNLIFRSLTQLSHSPLWAEIDIVFLATPHELSAKIVSEFIAQGKQVLDLSGAFRLKNEEVFAQYYGFEHPSPSLLQQAVYGLPEINAENLKSASLIAVAGCYPSASILSLAPVVAKKLVEGLPVINAVSGVSGAGKKALPKTSFCEVSLQAYGVGEHRHLPEIEQALTSEVIFTPHLGHYARGILATTTLKLSATQSEASVLNLFNSFYSQAPLVKVVEQLPSINDVAYTPYAQISCKLIKQGTYLQIFCAIDNLLKGAASNAVQCVNLANHWQETCGLISSSKMIAQEVAA